MRVLFATGHKYLPQMSGGAQSTVDQLCIRLQKRGHHVSVLAGLMPGGMFAGWSRLKMRTNKFIYGAQVTSSFGLGYRVFYSWFPWEDVGFVLEKERPDVVVVPAYMAVRMALAVRKYGVPVVMILQDVEFDNFGGDFCDLDGVCFVANSNFTAKRYKDSFGIDPYVIYPFIEKSKYITNSTRENITFVNPVFQKGVDLAIEIANLCGDIPFVFVESWPLSPENLNDIFQKIGCASNITLIRRKKDMREVYGKCKILLAPSVWEEAYGRVATEAQFSGIPVIASSRGGLPEAVGPGGIILDPQQSPIDWKNAVMKLWNDPLLYDGLSAAALNHSARLEMQIDRQVEEFERVLAKVSG